jgi:hypothetical protein
MSMTANVDPNNVAWYFGGRTTNSAGETVYVCSTHTLYAGMLADV